MRRLTLACSILGSLIAAGCAMPDGSQPSDGPADQALSPIVYGTVDTTHSAVVALLIDAGGGSFAGCSGTVVQIKNGAAYVLTAAHCCNMGAPSLVVQANDYGQYEQYIGSANPPAPAYAVDSTSIYYDTAYDNSNGFNHDFCMLKVPGMTGVAAIPVAQSGQDGLTNGVLTTQVEHVGYGQTQQDVQNETNPNWIPNSARRHGTNTVNIEVTNLILHYGQGGGTAPYTSGPCHGDSGGPALLAAGAAPGQQKVVGVTSYGPTGSCVGAGAEGVSVRVTSATGVGGFITNYLADTPSGTHVTGGSTGDCATCQQTAQNGACSAAAQACVTDSKCIQLSQCLQTCSDQPCVNTCNATAGTAAATKLQNYSDCICNTGCPTQCAAECGNSSSSSSSGGGACGIQFTDPACDTCLNGTCCAQITACANNAACINCLGSANPPASCNSNAQLAGLLGCAQSSCSVPCGISSSSSSSSTSSSGSTTTSSSSSTSSSGGATSSSSAASSASGNPSSSSVGSSGGTITGGGNGGNGGGGGSGGDGTGGNNQSSGCSMSAVGADATPASGASLAGLLMSIAFAFSRRRKNA